jgi:hypothetical protein
MSCKHKSWFFQYLTAWKTRISLILSSFLTQVLISLFSFCNNTRMYRRNIFNSIIVLRSNKITPTEMQTEINWCDVAWGIMGALDELLNCGGRFPVQAA